MDVIEITNYENGNPENNKRQLEANSFSYFNFCFVLFSCKKMMKEIVETFKYKYDYYYTDGTHETLPSVWQQQI